MTRSDAIRNEALRLDGFRCVVTGVDGRDEKDRHLICVHHKDELGMGGSAELDTIENCMTVAVEVHAFIHRGSLEIVEWARAAGVLTVIDHQGVLWKKKGRIPNERLWFHRRKLAEELEPIEARIQGLHMIDGDVARDLWRLWKDDAYKVLDPDMASFRQYAASRGWNARRASSMANLYDKAEQLRLPWPGGMSSADFRKQLQNAGHIEDREYWHIELRVPFGELIEAGLVNIHRCTSDAFADGQRPGLKVGKWYRLRVEKGILLDTDGRVLAGERD